MCSKYTKLVDFPNFFGYSILLINDMVYKALPSIGISKNIFIYINTIQYMYKLKQIPSSLEPLNYVNYVRK